MNEKKFKDIVLTLVVIFLISLTLNYLWESLHEAFLYEVFKCKADYYILMILEAALNDSLIILGMYLGVAALWKDMLWLQAMKGKQLIVAFTAGILVAIFLSILQPAINKSFLNPNH